MVSILLWHLGLVRISKKMCKAFNGKSSISTNQFKQVSFPVLGRV